MASCAIAVKRVPGRESWVLISAPGGASLSPMAAPGRGLDETLLMSVAGIAPRRVARVAGEKHRLVVLPLVNISPDPGDEYFADGMTEELISALSNVGGLSVIARTSAMKYKGATKSVAEIGRELDIKTLLEGSVRKAGNKVRIT